MKKLTPAAVAAPIFETHPDAQEVFVVGNFGFITRSSAVFYAGKKKITTVQRPDAATAAAPTPPTLTGNFKGLNKSQLLAQGELRGMKLSIDSKNADLIAQLEAYDAKLSRGDENPGDKNTNGAESTEGAKNINSTEGTESAENINATGAKNVE